MRWTILGGSGLLAGLVAWLVLWGAGPLLGPVLNRVLDDCSGEGCVGDAIGTAILAVAVTITLWLAAMFGSALLTLRLLRVDNAFGAAALGMVITVLCWWVLGELTPVTSVPGFALGTLANGLRRTS